MAEAVPTHATTRIRGIRGIKPTPDPLDHPSGSGTKFISVGQLVDQRSARLWVEGSCLGEGLARLHPSSGGFSSAATPGELTWMRERGLAAPCES